MQREESNPLLIAVSYRKVETSHIASRIHDWLVNRFGAPHVFIDHDITAGQDFAKELDWAFLHAHIVLVVIGQNWADSFKEGENTTCAKDYVCREIEAAFRSPLQPLILPVLLDGAISPDEKKLPESVKPITRKHACYVRADARFRSDVNAIFELIESELKRRSIEFQPPTLEERGGITDVYPEFPFSQMKSAISKAQKRIRILHTWTTYISHCEDVLPIALSRGVEIQIMLVSPDSESATIRGRDSEVNVSRSVYDTLKSIKRIFDKAQSLIETPLLEIRLYESLPYFLIYEVDRVTYIGLYSYLGKSHLTPHFSITGNDTIMRRFARDQFDELWSKASPYNLNNLLLNE